MKQILVASEIADLLRVDKQRIYELVRRNAIPVIRIGQRQYRFDAEAIYDWIANGGNSKNPNTSLETIKDVSQKKILINQNRREIYEKKNSKNVT
jgi:excisionase family DNA binding protein